MFLLNVKPTKKESAKIVANVTVRSGILSLECTLEKTEKGYFLNSPAKFVESIKSDKNNGFISQGKINNEFLKDVRDQAIKQYETKISSTSYTGEA